MFEVVRVRGPAGKHSWAVRRTGADGSKLVVSACYPGRAEAERAATNLSREAALKITAALPFATTPALL